MDNSYVNTMYLSTNDLNAFENRIESITNEVQEKIFGNAQSPLKSIEVGDNLNEKTLYLNIPANFYNTYDGIKFIDLATTNKGNKLRLIYTRRDSAGEDVLWITRISVQYLKKGNTIYSAYDLYGHLYDIDTGELTLESNIKRFKLPRDFGTVTAISTDNEGYQYIKIYDDETIMPNYVKYTWVDDEFPSMQKLDNIEKGIDNIGKYYYKPIGWNTFGEWLKTSTIENKYVNKNEKNISYTDLNRWLSNLNLINFEDLNSMTIWNSVVSEIDWNMQNDTDWEEL